MNYRAYRPGSSRRPLVTGCALLLSLAGPAFAQYTGEFSAANLGTGDSDALVGLRTDKEYFAAVNLGSATNLTINGVSFTGVDGVNPVGTNFTLTGVPNPFPSGGTNPGGVLGQLTNDFVYGGNTEVLTLNGLTVGESYVVTFYNRSWEAAGNRRMTMQASGASAVAGAFTFDEDMGATAQGSLNVLRYTFQAATAQQLINFVAQVAGTTMHQYGFSVERTFNNTWTGGTDWTTAAWSGAAPVGAGRSASFAAQGTPTAINLDADVTVGHIQFDGTSAWTVGSATGRTFTLQADVGGISNLSAKAGSHTVTPNIVLANNLLKTGAGSVTLSGVVSGAASVHSAGGVLRLEGANTYTGETVMAGGSVVEVTTLSNYGVPSSIGARTLAQENNTVTGVGLHFQGGTLRFVGSTPQSTNRHIRMLNGVNGATIDASGTVPEATMSFTNTGPNINLFDTGGTRTLNLTGTNTGANTFAIQLTNQAANATSINKAGAGTWHLTNNANNYTGLTQISGGILNVSSLSDYGVPSAIGARTETQEVAAGDGIGIWFGPATATGTLQYTGATPQSTNRQIRVGTGGATFDASGSNPAATMSFTFSGANTNLFDNPGTRAVTLTGSNTGANTFAIQLTDQAASFTSVNKRGAGTWFLTNTGSTYGGVTAIEGGILNVASLSDYGAPSALGSRASASDVSTNIGIVFRGGTLQYTGATPQSTNRAIRVSTDGGATIDASGSDPAATLSFTAATSPDFFENAGNRSVTLTGSNKGANTFGMAIVEIGGQTTLNKEGSGTWVLTGTSTYTGGTNVNAGTLQVNGTLGNTAVAVADGATLGGTGTIQGTVNTVAGSHIAPGTSVGTLTIGTLNLAANSVLDFEFGASADQLNISTAGGLAINGGNFNLFAEGGTTPWTTNGTYTLIDYNTNFTGSLGNLSVLNSQAGKNYTITDDGAGTSIQLAITDGVVNEWNGGAANGQWTTAGNWTGGAPNAAGVTAKFGTIPAGPTTVAVSGAKTVGSILFDNANSFSLTGTASDVITFSNGAGAGSITLASGSHSIAAPIALLGHLSTTVPSGAALTLGGSISGAGKTIALNGSGTLIFGGTNDYGSLLVNGGTVEVGTGGASGTLGSGDVIMGAGSTLRFNRSDSFTVANNLVGTGATIIKSGAGAVTLTGTNTIGTAGSGSVAINEGTLILGSAGALPANVSLAFAGGVLDLNGNATSLKALAIPAGTITDNSGTAGVTTLNLNLVGTTVVTGSITNGATRSLAVSLNGGQLQIGDGGTTGTLNVASLSLAPGAGVVLNRSNNVTVSANISGVGGTVTKQGTGTATLSGTNTFSTLNINSGAIRLGSAGALSAEMVVNMLGGVLDLNEKNVTIGALAGSGVITDNGAAATTTTLTVNQTTNTDFSGTIEEGAGQSVGLTKAGNGVLTLSGVSSNTYAGLTTVSGGTLQLQKAFTNAIVGNVLIGDANGSDILQLGASDQIGDASVVSFTAGGSGNSAFFRLNGFNETVHGIQTTVGQSSVIENNGPDGTTATLTVDVGTDNFTYDGIIRNASVGTSVFALTKLGSGTLTLASTAAVVNNSYSGATLIESGKMVLQNLGGTLPSPIAINQLGADTLTVNSLTRELSLTGVISGLGGITKNGPGGLNLYGANTISAPIIVNDGILGIGNDLAFGTSEIVMNGGNIRAVGAARIIGNSITANESFTVGRLTTFNGPITITKDLTIIANNPDGPSNNDTTLGSIGGNFRVSFAEGPQLQGAGSIVVNAVNTNTGGTSVLSGRVTVSPAGSLANAALAVDGGELNLNNTTQVVTSFSGAGGVVNLGAGHSLVVFQATDTTYAGALGGTGSFVKDGTGALTLTGASPSFTGTTTVTTGSLFVHGNLSGSNVTVTGTVLGGSGTVGNVSAVSGFIVPGASAGTFTMASLAMDADSVWQFELATPGVVASGINDLLSINGALTLDGTLEVTPLAGFGEGSYRLANYTGVLTDSGMELDSDFLAAYPGSTIDTSTLGEINLVIVPEPGSALLILGGLGIATSLRRRRTM